MSYRHDAWACVVPDRGRPMLGAHRCALAQYPRCTTAPRCVARNGPVTRKRAPVVPRAAAGRDGSAPLPQIWSEVVGWAKLEFEREVLLAKADAQINLGRACLLIALEEEASIEMHPELESQLRDMPIRFRSMGSASTWSLERMDSLAAEVMSVFLRDIAEDGDVQQQQQQQQRRKQEQAAGSSTPALISALPEGSSQEQGGSSKEELEQDSREAEEYPRDRDLGDSSGQPEALSREPGGSSQVPGEDSQRLRPLPEQPEPSSQEAGAAAGRQLEASPLGSGSTDAWDPRLAQQRVTQLLHAVNNVLFERHGYAACNRYGVPRDAQLSSVMESGVGCSAALSILYLEVCSRLGVQMAAKPLEQGRYFVLWPTSQPIMADGQRFVVDPYGCGGLLLASEVCEMFDVELSALWQPASRRQLLAALLGDLRDSYWARALGCNPNPSSMTPLSLATALDNKVGSINIHGLKRSLAAAEKRLGLLPHDRDAQLEFALLQYFSGHYDDAWIELGILLEKQQQHSKGATRQQHLPSVADQPVVVPEARTLRTELELEQPSEPDHGSAPPTEHLEQVRPGLYPTAASNHVSSFSIASTSDEPAKALYAAAASEPMLPASGPHSTSASGTLVAEDVGLNTGSLGQGSNNAEEAGCWLPLTEEQLQQVRVLLEKVRLQLVFSRTR